MRNSEAMTVAEAQVLRDEQSDRGLIDRGRGIITDGFSDLIRRPKDQVPVLDALRSLAVLLVVAGHFATDVAADARYPGLGRFFALPPFRFGWTGVDLFFILSGYLIGRQLWREFVRSGSVDVTRFILRRGFRIWPLYFVFVGLTCLARPHVPAWSDVLFVSNYVPGHVTGGWSLSTEEQFYIFIPVAVLLLRRWRARLWLALIPALIGAVLLARIITARDLLASGMSAADVKTVLYFPFHLRSEALFVGLLIALVSVIRPAWFARPRDAGFSWAGLGVAVAGLAVGGTLRWASNVIFPFTGLALIFGATAVWLLLDRSWVARLLDGHGFYVISRLSYGTYLNHLYVMGFVSPWVLAGTAKVVGSGSFAGVLALAATIICSLAVAAVTFVLVEFPFLQLRSHLMRPRAQALIATPGATATSAGGITARPGLG